MIDVGPPRTIMLPSAAIYRPDRLPPELLDTWIVLYGAAWRNRYRFTPPLSLAELTRLHCGTIHERSLVERLQRLEQVGWLTVTRSSGLRNVYNPIVPPEQAPVSDSEPAYAPVAPVAKAPVPRIARSGEELDRIAECLTELGLDTPEAREEALALEHVTAEYLEDWVMHKFDTLGELGPGYYRTQIRAGRASEHKMSDEVRKAYRGPSPRSGA